MSIQGRIRDGRLRTYPSEVEVYCFARNGFLTAFQKLRLNSVAHVTVMFDIIIIVFTRSFNDDILHAGQKFMYILLVIRLL